MSKPSSKEVKGFGNEVGFYLHVAVVQSVLRFALTLNALRKRKKLKLLNNDDQVSESITIGSPWSHDVETTFNQRYECWLIFFTLTANDPQFHKT